MIAEPYINLTTGEIQWFDPARSNGEPDFFDRALWRRYADFEREKLKAYGEKYSSSSDGSNPCYMRFGIEVDDQFGYRLHELTSFALLGYQGSDHDKDSEYSRLLKRAEFLKAVCEKEGVEWLPQEQAEGGYIIPDYPDMTPEERERIEASLATGPRRKVEYFGRYRWLPSKKVTPFYTKAEVDEKIRSLKKTAEIAAGMRWHGEREFRKALLDLLKDLPMIIPSTKVGRMMLDERVADLRDRFLSTPNKL